MRPSELMLDLGRPVAFYPGLAKHVGGVNACLFVCQLLYWSDRTDSEMGVYKTAEEWTRETGLSYKEQATARRKLRELGLITEVEKRLEHKIYYLLDVDALNVLIESANTPTGHPRKSHRAVRGEPEGRFVHTENTTETTTEIITSGASAPCDGFEAAWKDYPKREGANPKNKAHSCWKARLADGVTTEAMMAGVVRYAAYCKVKGSTGTSYVMQAVRFFGTERAFDNDWSVSTSIGKQSTITKDFSNSTYQSTPDDQFADFLQ